MNKKTPTVAVIVVIIAALIVMLIRHCAKKEQGPGIASYPVIQKNRADSAAHPSPSPPNKGDTVGAALRSRPIHATGEIEKPAVAIPGGAPETTGSGQNQPIDTVAEAASQPVGASRETVSAGIDKCRSDTARPWVYADPAGGLHYRPVSVTLSATKPCLIRWRTDEAAPWNVYGGGSVYIDKSKSLFLSAVDSCGNAMGPRSEFYEIRPPDALAFCPDEMVLVRTADAAFCIDRYEWPNKKGRIPRTYISIYQAMDTCASAGKRLCATDEWTLACSGPKGWRYPYGPFYEIHACVTNDTVLRPSGSKPDCRGYYGAYDMSGNCAEWTSTRSAANRQFYNVMGGFWESSQESGCFDSRYSYFPQNRHNPVGFRCCKDVQLRNQGN